MDTSVAEEILNSPDYFRCDRLHLRMAKKECGEMSLRENSRAVNMCKGCEQGIEIRKELRAQSEGIMTETKICNKCGQEKSLDDFPKNHACRDGHAGACKQCRNDYQVDFRARKKKGAVSEPPEPETEKKPGKDSKIILDFGRWPEVREALEEEATIQIRTTELQAIAYIVKGLKGDGYGSDHAGD